MNTETFASLVKTTSDSLTGKARFGRKVWIHRAWTAGPFYGTYGIDFATFKAMLWAAHVAGQLQLSRCDMVEAFAPQDVSRSNMVASNGSLWNFISF